MTKAESVAYLRKLALKEKILGESPQSEDAEESFLELERIEKPVDKPENNGILEI